VTSEYGPMRARVDLVVHEVVQLQHVHDADGDVLLERLAGAAVEEDRLTGLGQAGLLSVVLTSVSRAPSNTGVAMCTPRRSLSAKRATSSSLSCR
jgi:hypothetical protein